MTSCKEEGCTEKAALNYNITATKEDGSCIFCEETRENFGAFAVLVKDRNSFSPCYNEEILRIELSRRARRFNDGSCGTEECVVDARFTNLTDQDITDLRFTISMQPFGYAPFLYSENDPLSVPKGADIFREAVHVATINQPGAPCPNIDSAY